jgi:hypothetical protein
MGGCARPVCRCTRRTALSAGPRSDARNWLTGNAGSYLQQCWRQSSNYLTQLSPNHHPNRHILWYTRVGQNEQGFANGCSSHRRPVDRWAGCRKLRVRIPRRRSTGRRLLAVLEISEGNTFRCSLQASVALNISVAVIFQDVQCVVLCEVHCRRKEMSPHFPG